MQLRRHGDIFERLPGSYYTAKGRSDDTMNLGGIKVQPRSCQSECKTNVKPFRDLLCWVTPDVTDLGALRISAAFV